MMEAPFRGKYYLFDAKGKYACANCGSVLFLSKNKFYSGSGWPCFDAARDEAVNTENHDGAGRQISCKQCGAKLGQLFTGEGFTESGKRYNVSSEKIKFIPEKGNFD